MAMTLRLDEAETEALRARAARDGISMQEVAKAALRAHLSDRPDRLKAAIERVQAEDAELLERLGR